MQTLQQSGWEKVQAGYTTLEEVLRVITVTDK
jgi:general secretion pathway protein E